MWHRLRPNRDSPGWWHTNMDRVALSSRATRRSNWHLNAAWRLLISIRVPHDGGSSAGNSYFTPPAASKFPAAKTDIIPIVIDPGTCIDEVAAGIYRICTPLDVIPGGFTFNSYLIDDNEPLLFHTGYGKPPWRQ